MHLQITSSESGGMEVVIDGVTYRYALDDIYKPAIWNHYKYGRFGSVLASLEKVKFQSWRVEG